MNIMKGQRWKNAYYKSNVTIKHIENGIVFYYIYEDENDYFGLPVDSFLAIYIYDNHVQVGQTWSFTYPSDFYFIDGLSNTMVIDVLEILSNGHEARCLVTFADGDTLENEIYLTEEFKTAYWKLL